MKVEDFAKISFKEQINIIGNTDVLLSVHGNGLSHLLFLPPTATVIEIFPPDAHLLDYRLFANARGLNYFGIISNREILDNKSAYEIDPFGNTHATINSLDIQKVLSIIANSKNVGN